MEILASAQAEMLEFPPGADVLHRSGGGVMVGTVERVYYNITKRKTYYFHIQLDGVRKGKVTKAKNLSLHPGSPIWFQNPATGRYVSAIIQRGGWNKDIEQNEYEVEQVEDKSLHNAVTSGSFVYRREGSLPPDHHEGGDETAELVLDDSDDGGDDDDGDGNDNPKPGDAENGVKKGNHGGHPPGNHNHQPPNLPHGQDHSDHYAANDRYGSRDSTSRATTTTTAATGTMTKTARQYSGDFVNESGAVGGGDQNGRPGMTMAHATGRIPQSYREAEDKGHYGGDRNSGGTMERHTGPSYSAAQNQAAPTYQQQQQQQQQHLLKRPHEQMAEGHGSHMEYGRQSSYSGPGGGMSRNSSGGGGNGGDGDGYYGPPSNGPSGGGPDHAGPAAGAPENNGYRMDDGYQSYNSYGPASQTSGGHGADHNGHINSSNNNPPPWAGRPGGPEDGPGPYAKRPRMDPADEGALATAGPSSAGHYGAPPGDHDPYAHYGSQARTIVKVLNIPVWADIDLLRGHLIGTKGIEHKRFMKFWKCGIWVWEDRDQAGERQLYIKVRCQAGQDWRRIISALEDRIVDCVHMHDRNLMYYCLAIDNDHHETVGGVVFQRLPPLKDMQWFQAIPVPDFFQEYLDSRYGGGKYWFRQVRDRASARGAALCTIYYRNSPHPYVLVYGARPELVTMYVEVINDELETQFGNRE